MRMLVVLCLLFASSAAAQTPDPGRLIYATRCAGCHGTDGNGGELGPSIIMRVPARTDEELTTLFHQGLPTAGMPAFPGLAETDVRDLIRLLRALQPREGSRPERTKIALSTGASLEGVVLNQGGADLQVLGDDRRIHLFRKSGDRYRPVTSQSDWPSYNGQTTGSRYSTLTQITRSNVGRMVPKWSVGLPNTPSLQTTPVVVDGVMYVTSANQCYALDAGSGREIWHYTRPRTRGLVGNAAGGANRGVGVAGDRVFMVTDHAHLIALNRHTGALVWETQMADWKQNYNATGALALFTEKCAGCHGTDVAGGRAAGLFDQKVLARLDDDRLARIIRAGLPAAGMPGFDDLTEEQVGQLIHHIRAETGNLAPKPAFIANPAGS